jgi:hypothetical protein
LNCIFDHNYLNKPEDMRFFLFLLIPLIAIACNKDNEYTGSPEMVIIDSVITATVNDDGCVYFNAPVSHGTNWIHPYDFFNGTFQCRYEIKKYPSEKTFLLNLCIWSDIVGNWDNYRESCSEQITITGRGAYTSQSSPSGWWKKDIPVDFSRIEDFFSMGLIFWCENYQNMGTWEPDCWSHRNDFMPMTLRLTVVAVADGHTFSGWENYID